MTRFNKRKVATARTVQGPLATVPAAPGTAQPRTFEGSPGFTRTAKSELFLLATTSLDIAAKAFYETGDDRVERFRVLVRQVAVEDPDWTFEFLKWLRGPGNIRTAAIVGAVEAVRALRAADIEGGRAIMAAVQQRADEPGEATAYHLAHYGRKMPMPLKRGIGDGALQLYNEYTLLKYDTESHGVRFADVLELTHPGDYFAAHQTFKGGWQKALFKYAIDRRHGHDDLTQIVGTGEFPTLPKVYENIVLRSRAAENPDVLFDAEAVQRAGLTWEDVLSLVGSKVDKAQLWKALIPSMNFMARLRNLRNFDQAGLSDADVQPVIDMLTDAEWVAKSRQLPMRFLSAYRHTDNLRWAYPLEVALDLSLGNVPQLKGRTLILIDTSRSMRGAFGKDSSLKRWDAAVVFGLALARRCENHHVVSFSETSKVFPQRKGESLLAAVNRFDKEGYFLDQGTLTAEAVRTHFTDHDRVIILTDEQAGAYTPAYAHAGQLGRYNMYYGMYDDRDTDPGKVLPAATMLFTANLAGYQVSHTEASPTRISIGGLTDQLFSLIPVIEAGKDGTWPWEQAA